MSENCLKKSKTSTLKLNLKSLYNCSKFVLQEMSRVIEV